mmetsp:Transcript_1494/g.2258  ORF Transcript_1494/g.2258 Transcript_1494/m.2258 type:complete len:128 (+) Transcript_1494:975-1358(+)
MQSSSASSWKVRGMEEMQPRTPPPLDSSMISRRIEFCHQYSVHEEAEDGAGDGSILVWCGATIDAIFTSASKKNTANIRWDEDILAEGESPVSTQKLLPRLWNKTKHGGWRFAEEELTTTVAEEGED